MKKLALTFLSLCMATNALAGSVNIPASHTNGEFCCKTSGGLLGMKVKFDTKDVDVNGFPGHYTLSKSQVDNQCFSYSKPNVTKSGNIDYKIVSGTGSVDCSEK